VAVFDALHRRGTVSEAMLCPFDLLKLDRRGPPLPAAGRPQEAPGEGWWVSGGPASYSASILTKTARIFLRACRMGLEGNVSERVSAPIPLVRAAIGPR
jgi:hypothetical protein